MPGEDGSLDLDERFGLEERAQRLDDCCAGLDGFDDGRVSQHFDVAVAEVGVGGFVGGVTTFFDWEAVEAWGLQDRKSRSFDGNLAIGGSVWWETVYCLRDVRTWFVVRGIGVKLTDKISPTDQIALTLEIIFGNTRRLDCGQ